MPITVTAAEQADIQRHTQLVSNNAALRQALKPFAAMDRPDCDLNEIVARRGTGYDATQILSADFRIAHHALEPR